jgi:hypothetical protein
MKIIGISGRKQSGKNTVANYIHGQVLQKLGMISDFFINESGQLAIQTLDSSGNNGYGILDVTRKDKDFVSYAEKELWPYVKIYHFADPLKDLAVNLFDLNEEDVYGNDEQKNQHTDLLWENMPNNFANKQGKMTNREFLEHFGTNIVRKIKYDAWSEYSIKKILKEQAEIAIVPDIRFPNEVHAIKNSGGAVIRLTRDIFNSQTEPEKSLDKEVFDWENFDLIVDNASTTLEELCSLLNHKKWMWS